MLTLIKKYKWEVFLQWYARICSDKFHNILLPFRRFVLLLTQVIHCGFCSSLIVVSVWFAVCHPCDNSIILLQDEEDEEDEDEDEDEDDLPRDEL